MTDEQQGSTEHLGEGGLAEVSGVSESAARRLADAFLVEALRADGFQGRSYSRFEEELARYGMAVISSWISTGKIFTQASRQGFPLKRPSRPLTPDESDELAMESTARALRSFKRMALQEGRWRPDGGADLKTYFLGACVLEFANVYRQFSRSIAREREFIPLDEEIESAASLESDPIGDLEQQMFAKATIADMLRTGKLDSTTAAALQLMGNGYTITEVANILGVSPRLIARRRQQLRRLTEDAATEQR